MTAVKLAEPPGVLFCTQRYHTRRAETPLHKLLNKLSTNPKIVQSLLNISGTRQLRGGGGDKKLLSFLVATQKQTQTHAHTDADGQLEENLHLVYSRAERITATKAVF